MAIDRLGPYDHGARGFGSPRKKVLVIRTLKAVLEQQGYDMEDERDNKSVWSTEALHAGLFKYDKTPELRVNERSWRRAYMKTLYAFRPNFEVLETLEDSDLPSSIKLNKSSGLPFLRKKGEVVGLELERMVRIRKGAKAPDPCIAYHRIQHGPEGPKTRLVWGYPMAMTLLEAQFAVPLIAHFKLSQSPMAFGYTKMDLWARMTSFSRSEVVVGLDYSGFDSSIHARLVAMAFSVLGRFFTDEAKEAGNWEKVVQYFIHTPILMPDNQVYRKHHGVPSGSFFTQLVDSIVNYFALAYVNDRIEADDVDMLVLGDDSLVSLGESKVVERNKRYLGGLKSVYQVGLRELGLVVNMKKSQVFHGRDRRAIHFLGHTWSKGYPHREARELAIRMVYPETYNPAINPADYIRMRQISFLGDAVEAWPMIRPMLTVNRLSVCASVNPANLKMEILDLGWFRALEAVDRPIRVSLLAYTGLLV